MKMFRRSTVISLRPKKDAPAGIPLCPGCKTMVTSFHLVVPSLGRRIGWWLVGQGWSPSAFVVLTPCDHITAKDSTVTMVAATAAALAMGQELTNTELVPSDEQEEEFSRG